MSITVVSDFTKKVLKIIAEIPEGRVATYKQIAILSGKPQASRGVSWILHSCSTKYKLPWHRVLNSSGRISFEKGTHNFRQQKKRLEREGVVLSPDGELELSRFQWKKKVPKKKTKNSPKMFA
jgi:methylated-DNA-protein-cysteine methyltransferase-like protein